MKPVISNTLLSSIVIDGFHGSGKSVLKGILDGHPDIVVSKAQESILSAFCQAGITSYIEPMHYRKLREILACHSQYFDLERLHNQGSIELSVSHNSQVSKDIAIDFYKLDEQAFSQLKELDSWSVENITRVFHQSFINIWAPPSGASYHYVTMEDNVKGFASYLMTSSSAKLIYVKRSIPDIVASLSGRRALKNDPTTSHWDTNTSFKLLWQGVALAAADRQQEAEIAAANFPDRVLVVEFDQLVSQCDDTLNRICNFIGVQRSETMNYCSIDGQEVLASNGEKYLGKTLDSAKELLSEQMFALAKIHGKESVDAPPLLLRTRWLSAFIRLRYRCLGIPIVRAIFYLMDKLVIGKR